jgi:hypothetical protein
MDSDKESEKLSVFSEAKLTSKHAAFLRKKENDVWTLHFSS